MAEPHRNARLPLAPRIAKVRKRALEGDPSEAQTRVDPKSSLPPGSEAAEAREAGWFLTDESWRARERIEPPGLPEPELDARRYEQPEIEARRARFARVVRACVALSVGILLLGFGSRLMADDSPHGSRSAALRSGVPSALALVRATGVLEKTEVVPRTARAKKAKRTMKPVELSPAVNSP